MGNVAQMKAGVTASITEFKANPNSLIEAAQGEALAILKGNKPCFYAVPTELFEIMQEALEDLALLSEARERLSDGSEPIAVTLDEL